MFDVDSQSSALLDGIGGKKAENNQKVLIPPK